jgi:hypothetical protein
MPKGTGNTAALLWAQRVTKSDEFPRRLMQGENFLLAIGRIALTFVGFASLVSLLRHADRKWLPQEVRGIKLMFEFDLAVTFFSLLPFPLLYSLGKDRETTLWRIASLILVLYLAYALWFHWRSYTQTMTPGRHPTLFRWTFVAPMIGVLLFEIWATACHPSLATYTWGLLWLLIPPVVQFGIFIKHFGEPQSGAE